MVRILVLDGMRRSAQLYGLVGLFALVLGPVTVLGFMVASTAWSMPLAFVLGPWMTLGVFNQREIYVLPVSRAVFWRAQWILGVLVAPAYLAAVKLAAATMFTLPPAMAARGGTPDTSLIALAALLDVAYCGLFFALLSQAGRLRLPLPPRIRAHVQPALLTVLLGGGIIWPFLLVAGGLRTGLLPLAWSDLQGPAGVFLAGVLVVVVGAAFHTPRPVARASAVLTVARPSTGSEARSAAPHRTGMRMLMVQELAIGAAISGAILAAFAILVLTRDGAAGLMREVAHLERPFDGTFGLMRPPVDSPPVAYLFGVVPVVGVHLIFLLFLCTRNAMFPLVRQLRALPVSTSTLAAYVVGFSTFTWVPLLALIAVLVTAGTGRFPAFDLSQLLLLGGMVALGHALSLLLGVPHGSFARMTPMTVFVLGAAAAPLGLLPPAIASAVTPAVLGAAALAAAFALLRLLLARAPAVRPAAAGTGVVPLTSS